MKRLFLFCFVCALCVGEKPLNAQNGLSEMPDPKPISMQAWDKVQQPVFVWGSTDVRYKQLQFPKAEVIPELYAWKGERVSAQAVFASPIKETINLKVSDLKCGSHIIPAECIRAYFVYYVLTDTYDNRNDSFLMADRLVLGKSEVAARTVRPVWLDIRVPREAVPGKYTGAVSVEGESGLYTLPLHLTVGKRILPEPSEWKFHLDLWQNPYAVARYFDVPLWSQEHFDAMRPLMEMYAEAGGKVITTSIMQHPWNSQTEDPFESMIVKMKHVDGSWTYDYTVFDRWVEFMFSCGVNRQIDCYTIVPWGYTFEYVDMASSTLKYVECKPGEKAYEEYILPFLRDFAGHLKSKGWFERTCIAMDERPMEQFRAAFEVVRKADPGFRVKGAVDYSPEISTFVPLMYDISLIYDQAAVPEQVTEQRKNERQQTTFYTCCKPAHPNTFTFSPPAESAWLGWHAAALGFDGYLRWAYNSWVKDPCRDSRFRKWLSGDCYLVYPSGSSIRFERLIQGIQDYEKLRILRQDASPARLKKLDAILEPFREIIYDPTVDAAAEVRKAESALRSLE